MVKTICELFAGVGGFRLGFERLNSGWNTVWFSQWEPNEAKQWAHKCYVEHFGDLPDINDEYHTNEDISIVNKNNIPNHTLLVGGFPCQDYSVAHSLSTSKGIEGKKGVLWWQIYEILKVKNPAFCIFENVDRLLKSPAKQRGRDFGIILCCLNNLGYSVEWKVVNAADYGEPQKRRRVFIFCYKSSTKYAVDLPDDIDHIKHNGFMANVFKGTPSEETFSTDINSEIIDVSDNFGFSFSLAGYMCKGKIFTWNYTAITEKVTPLKDVLEKETDIKYRIKPENIEKWKYLKSSKRIPRVNKDGFEYIYSEGAMAFPDNTDLPARTILTSEGSINRSSHVVKDLADGNLRILTPLETERLQGFDDNWTDTGMPERKRYFCMGNALSVPMVEKMGKELDKIIEYCNKK